MYTFCHVGGSTDARSFCPCYDRHRLPADLQTDIVYQSNSCPMTICQRSILFDKHFGSGSYTFLFFSTRSHNKLVTLKKI